MTTLVLSESEGNPGAPARQNRGPDSGWAASSSSFFANIGCMMIGTYSSTLAAGVVYYAVYQLLRPRKRVRLEK